jgi:short-subunit dehydrogenase
LHVRACATAFPVGEALRALAAYGRSRSAPDALHGCSHDATVLDRIVKEHGAEFLRHARASYDGPLTFPLMGAYNSTKYAVESLSDALRNELHPFGIQVSIVEPGPIRTEFNDRATPPISASSELSSSATT